MADESDPRNYALPNGTEVVAGYIGGDTPHIWTDAQWDGFKVPYRLPIFVRSVGGVAIFDANETTNWLESHKVPKGSLVALDFETRVDPTYVNEYDKAVVEKGYKVLLYGSLSTIVQNPMTSGGRWIADWNGQANLMPGSVAHQYVSENEYDLSEIDANAPLWKIEVVPNPQPGSSLPTVKVGDSGEFVRTVQALCTARHTLTGVDGTFGPVTEKNVREVQNRYGVKIDGIVGAETWHVLIYAAK